jgi:hypothetical protein
MKALTTITLQGSHKLLRVGSIRSPAALPRMAVRGRAFLSERADDIRFRYYKGGQSRVSGVPTSCSAQECVGPALKKRLGPPYDRCVRRNPMRTITRPRSCIQVGTLPSASQPISSVLGGTSVGNTEARPAPSITMARVNR